MSQTYWMLSRRTFLCRLAPPLPRPLPPFPRPDIVCKCLKWVGKEVGEKSGLVCWLETLLLKEGEKREREEGLYMAWGKWRAGLRRIRWDDESRHGPNKDNAEK